MTYDSNETSVEAGRPVELFKFTAGSRVFRYTSDESEHTVGVEVYEPRAISREDTEEGPGQRDSNLSIKLPMSDPLSQIFVGVLGGSRVRLQLRRFHRDDGPTPQVVIAFDGFVHGASFSPDLHEITLTCRSSLADSGDQIPPWTFQGSCNGVLYDEDSCDADSTSPAVRAAARAVLSATGNVLEVDDLGGYAAGWFTGGYVEEVGGDGDVRFILDDDGAGNLTLIMPFATTPTVVNVLAGCDRTIGANGCLKHNNVINFRAFAFVPTENVFDKGLDT